MIYKVFFHSIVKKSWNLMRTYYVPGAEPLICIFPFNSHKILEVDGIILSLPKKKKKKRERRKK